MIAQCRKTTDIALALALAVAANVVDNGKRNRILLFLMLWPVTHNAVEIPNQFNQLT